MWEIVNRTDFRKTTLRYLNSCGKLYPINNVILGERTCYIKFVTVRFILQTISF